MAKRYWEVTTSMGYVGTETTEKIDLIEEGLYTEEELETLTDDQVVDQLYDDAFDIAQQMIDISVK